MKFDIQTVVCQTTGTYHSQAGLSCQDVVYIRESDGLFFCGLADGQSGKTRGAEGGRVCLEIMEAYIRSQGVSNLTGRAFADELPCMFMQQIRAAIQSLAAAQNCDFSQYASTLLAIAIHPGTGDYILLHLGDGCALGIGVNDDLALLSRPENGLTHRHTWLTTSLHAVPHFRVTFGNLGNHKRLVLLTDGADCLFQAGCVPRRAKALLCAGDASDVRQYLHRHTGGDDAACILLELP